MNCIKYTTRKIAAALFAALLIFGGCKKDKGMDNPTANKLDPQIGSGGDMLTLTGGDLANMRSIVFEKDSVPVFFNPNFNTANAVLFRVPDTASGGLQNIIFTNNDGKTLLVPFTVMAYPKIKEVSNYDFVAGDTLELTGINLETASKVVLHGTSDAATIISTSRKKLVIKMPSTTLDRAPLDITNVSGTSTTTQEFVNVDNAFKIFTDAYGVGIQNGSWGDAAVISTSVFKSGHASVGKNYQKANWHLIGFANWGTGFAYDASYKYLTVWVKGASADYSLYIDTDKSPSAWDRYTDDNKIVVPANVWTYFKIPLTSLKLWGNGTDPFSNLGFRIKGPDSKDETFYFDDVLLVK